MKAAQAEVGAAQKQKEAKANAVIVQKEAKRLAEQTRDFAAAARMLEGIDSQWRDAKLYENICGYRDKVKTLDAAIQDAVHKGRLLFLRGRVQELLKLQPKRDDMRRLLDVLPEEPELPCEFTNSIGIKFVLIEPGEFTMGTRGPANERPPHVVAITQPFYLGVFPVTQAEYQAVMEWNRCHFRENARQPVENVSWNDAVTFCDRLSQLPGEVQHGARYRLPTEAEWEYACRAGSTGKWCFGDNGLLLGDYAWFDKNSGKRTHIVGEKKPNAWGLHDMHGNVWEWCEDLCDKDGLGQVYRGGSWLSSATRCRSADRSHVSPTCSSSYLGFRIALSSPSVK